MLIRQDAVRGAREAPHHPDNVQSKRSTDFCLGEPTSNVSLQSRRFAFAPTKCSSDAICRSASSPQFPDSKGAGDPLSQLLRSGRGEADPVPESVAAPKPINQNYAAPDSFGTHAPRDKENHPASPKCRRESTPEPRCCFGATPLVGELPRSNGQTTAWPSAPSRACKGDKRG
jgi:hypothetical protein